MLLMLVISSVSLAVDLELTQGQSKALPIALVPFKGDQSSQISQIIENDLRNSGAFNFIKYNSEHQPHNVLQAKFSYWRSSGANNLIVGDVEQKGNEYSVNVQLLDPIGKAHLMLSREYRVPAQHLRALAHHISDMLYQQLTGHRGIFSTRLAYILVERDLKTAKTSYRLEVSDYDGDSSQSLLISSQPIMSPSWSPDGSQIAYVSFENRKAEIYIVNVSDGQRQLITSFPGINGAPSWSPTGNELALVLSKSGSPKIYLYNLKNKSLKQLTDGVSIDTEPKFTPKGTALTFTSNRGGSPQVYRINLKTKKIKRLTFAGSYNASATISPSNKEMILLHRNAKSFSIALQELSSGLISPLSFSKFDESPSLAPNGQMVVYATKFRGKGILRVATLDGKHNIKLSTSNGEMQEPAWSPFLAQ